MIMERNGVTFFEDKQDYADHPAFKALSKVSLGDVRFPFGFFLVEEGGKTVVIPGTEEDHRKTLLRAFPDIDPKTLTHGRCIEAPGLRCTGGCPGYPTGYKCMRYTWNDRQYGCGCVPIF
jgi:hypothetical protein